MEDKDCCIFSQCFFCTPDYITPETAQVANEFDEDEVESLRRTPLAQNLRRSQRTIEARCTEREVAKGLLKYQPDVIISVHPLMQHVPLRILRSKGLLDKIPFTTVITDLSTCHPTWFHKLVTRCYCPSIEVEKRALKAGLKPSQIKVYGLPVRPSFVKPIRPKDEQRRELGMDEDLPAVLLMGGGEGMGPIEAIAKALGDSLYDENLGEPTGQILVICVRNKKLANRLQSINWKVPVQVKGFVTKMEECMGACDCIITKKLGYSSKVTRMEDGIRKVLGGKSGSVTRSSLAQRVISGTLPGFAASSRWCHWSQVSLGEDHTIPKIVKLDFQSNDNLNLGGVKNVQTVSCPDLHVSVPKAVPYKSKGYPLSETTAPDLHLSERESKQYQCQRNPSREFFDYGEEDGAPTPVPKDLSTSQNVASSIHTKVKGVPDGFFDHNKTGSGMQPNEPSSETAQAKGSLPKGLFDNKDADLRARGIQPQKVDMNDAYKEFEKEIQEDLREVDDRLEEEEIDAAAEREEYLTLEQHRKWVGGEVLKALAYDVPIPGYKIKNAISLRLWEAKATAEDFNLFQFNDGQYESAAQLHARAQQVFYLEKRLMSLSITLQICAVLFPVMLQKKESF
ncbi:unnamed protein product [Miscanthus lutarioriparius]|uniref:Diacylglycerol glucosyltransferase N-terminal domain-containing protein n=1 Tax=Miscanthus lutarioriparius TaxID=422564 RepID=A0A811QF16_9POAL|nr:unnamed protein product [Miscanthus lutarioriparius]